MKTRTKVFSTAIKDCEVQTFTCGGRGGSGKDTSNNGVRVIHHPSGARGECREQRHQLANKRIAFKRMGETKQFQSWARLQVAKLLKTQVDLDKWVEEEMRKVKIEVKDSDGKWVEVSESSLV